MDNFSKMVEGVKDYYRKNEKNTSRATLVHSVEQLEMTARD